MKPFNERAILSRAGATALRTPDYRPERQYDFERVQRTSEEAHRRRVAERRRHAFRALAYVALCVAAVASIAGWLG